MTVTEGQICRIKNLFNGILGSRFLSALSLFKLLHSLLNHLFLLLQLNVVSFLIQFQLNFTPRILVLLIIIAASYQRSGEFSHTISSNVNVFQDLIINPHSTYDGDLCLAIYEEINELSINTLSICSKRVLGSYLKID